MSSQLREGRHVHEAARVWGLGFRVDEVVLINPFLPARYLIRWSTAMYAEILLTVPGLGLRASSVGFRA